MPLDDTERRVLAEIEQRLEAERPDLARAMRKSPRARVRVRLDPVPAALATVVFAAACGWLGVWTGRVLPGLLALPVVLGVAAVLCWQRLGRTVPDPATAADRPAQDGARPGAADGGDMPWWLD